MDYAIVKDWAGPLATVIAAGAAAFVAFRLGQNQISVARTQAEIAQRNWQTSNEKIVLELFERRLKIYEDIRDVIGKNHSKRERSERNLFSLRHSDRSRSILFRARSAGLP
jgi:shikimate kinase